MKNKKSQGLSLNTIIIAAIVLIVLVVLWAIFTGRMGKFSTGLKAEEEKAEREADRLQKIAAGGGTPLEDLNPCFGGQTTGDECRCGNERCIQPETPGGCADDGGCR